MRKSPISPCLILLALAAIVPFGSAEEFGLSTTFTQYSDYYESQMQSQAQQMYNKLEAHVNALAEKIGYADYAKTATDIPLVRQAAACVQKKFESTKKSLIEIVQLLIRLVSYARALQVEIHTCFNNASVPGAPKVPVCIMDVTGKVAQASIQYQQRLVLDAVKIFVNIGGIANTVKNCALYNQ